MRTTILGLTLCIAAAAPAIGQDKASPIATLLEPQTLLVGRVDVRAVEPEQLAKLADTLLLPAMPEDLHAEYNQVRQTLLEMVHPWRKAFLDAGGTELWVVVTLADDISLPAVVAVPLAKGADAAALTRLLVTSSDGSTTRPAILSIGMPAAKGIRGLLVAGRASTLDLLSEMTPADLPRLAKALTAAGDAPVQIAYVPSDDTLRVLSETLPELPKELGGGSAQPLATGMRWAGIGVWVTPKLRIAGRIGSTDAEAAKDLRSLLDRLLSAGSQDKHIRKMAPNFKDVLAPLLPKPDGAGLAISLSQEQAADAIQKVLSPVLREARRQGRRSASMVHSRGIVTSLIVYGNSHDGVLPAQEAFKTSLGASAYLLRNPRLESKEVGYVYLRPPGRLSQSENPTETVLLYEAFDTWPADGIVVGFADGHVQTIEDPQKFERLTGVKIPVQAEPKAAAGGE